MGTTNIMRPVAAFSTSSGGTRYYNYYGTFSNEDEARCVLPKCKVIKWTMRVHTRERTFTQLNFFKNGVNVKQITDSGILNQSAPFTITVTMDEKFAEGDEFSIGAVSTGAGGTELLFAWGVIEYVHY